MNLQLVFFAFSTVVAVAVNSVFLYKVYESGKRQGKYFSKSTFYNHTQWVYRFLFVTILTVLMVEGMIQTKYNWEGVTHLFDTTIGMVHAVCDALYAVTLICMIFVFTGIKAPTIHKYLFKIVLVSYITVVITGTWLMVKLIL